MSIELEDECVFSDQEYSTICEFAQNGQTGQLKEFLRKTIGQQRVGDQTFAADATSLNPVRRLSPLSYAARSGRVDTVKCFLRQFPNAIVLNPTAGGGGSFVHPGLDKHLHHDLPLYWACLNGHLEVAKVLVAAGALVNCPNCMQATPLHAAVSNGHLQVMEFLVGKAADLNAADVFGRSPLIAAASGGHARAVEYLLGRGADVNQLTVDGYTVMHVAAERGHIRVVKTLLARGVPPMFNEGMRSIGEEGLIPCPIFLAAVNGHDSVVSEFLSRKRKCPTACNSDTMMLLGVGHQRPPRRGVYPVTYSTTLEMVEKSWARGLELRHQINALQADFKAIQLPAYGNRKELDSMRELHSVIQSREFEEVVYQSLIIMERCLGQGSQIIFESCLGQENLELLSRGFADECIHTIMQAAVQTWQSEIRRSVFRDPSAIQPLVENYLQRFVSRHFTADIDSIQKSVDVGLSALEVLLELRAVHTCEGISLQSALSSLLYLFAIWLQYDYASKRESLVSCEMYSGPEECERLGQKLVSEHLHSLEGTTLLHMALNGSKLVSEAQLMSFGHLFSSYNADSPHHRTNLDLGLLVRALLRWGANAAIDVFDWNGQRPLHLAVKLTNMDNLQVDVITPLVNCGAHLDYVNKEGKTPLTMCRSDESRQLLTPPGPLPLACLACRKILKEKIVYNVLNIPIRVKNIIYNHDPHSVS